MLSAIFDIFLMLEEGERNSSCPTEKHFKFLYRAASWCFQSFYTAFLHFKYSFSIRYLPSGTLAALSMERGRCSWICVSSTRRGTIGLNKESECQNTEICRWKHTQKNRMVEWGCKLRFFNFFHNFSWCVCRIAYKIQISDSTRSLLLTMTLVLLNVAQIIQTFSYFITELCS